jgi:hypothetical protein
MILNKIIRNFSKEVLTQVDKEWDRAWDQIVSRTVTTIPPPIDTDPCILGWIDYKTLCLKEDTEAHTLHKAKQQALVLFKQ